MSDEPLRVRIPLHVPIVHGDETLTEIELIEPTYEAMQMIDRAQGDIERSIRTICACTGLPPSVIKQLRARDIRRLNEEVAKWMGEADESPVIGEKPELGSLTPFTGRRAN